MLDCPSCAGWMAAVGAMLAFGTFGVPIKSQVATMHVDPLVFQSYKTFMCFLTSWFILLVPGMEFEFTPWGIASGLFWVPGGVATIYGIQCAGLALGMGISSACIVLSSFTWGVFVFREPVHSIWGACLAVTCLMTGLFGMSYFSSPSLDEQSQLGGGATSASAKKAATSPDAAAAATTTTSTTTISSPSSLELATIVTTDTTTPTSHYHRRTKDDQEIINRTPPLSLLAAATTAGSANIKKRGQQHLRSTEDLSDPNYETNDTTNNAFALHDDEDIALLQGAVLPSTPTKTGARSASSSAAVGMVEFVHICGTKIPKRECSMALTALFGFWGGSTMAPMKLCKSDIQGARYVISFGIGASIVNAAFWACRLAYHAVRRKSLWRGYQRLPPFYVNVLWLPGGLAGLFWSIGNFCSLLAVHSLGQGVGYSLVQSQLLVSGLWGICWFGEIKGRRKIVGWLASAAVTLLGIILLGNQHVVVVADEKSNGKGIQD